MKLFRSLLLLGLLSTLPSNSFAENDEAKLVGTWHSQCLAYPNKTSFLLQAIITKTETGLNSAQSFLHYEGPSCSGNLTRVDFLDHHRYKIVSKVSELKYLIQEDIVITPTQTTGFQVIYSFSPNFDSFTVSKVLNSVTEDNGKTTVEKVAPKAIRDTIKEFSNWKKVSS